MSGKLPSVLALVVVGLGGLLLLQRHQFDAARNASRTTLDSLHAAVLVRDSLSAIAARNAAHLVTQHTRAARAVVESILVVDSGPVAEAVRQVQQHYEGALAAAALQVAILQAALDDRRALLLVYHAHLAQTLAALDHAQHPSALTQLRRAAPWLALGYIVGKVAP